MGTLARLHGSFATSYEVPLHPFKVTITIYIFRSLASMQR